MAAKAGAPAVPVRLATGDAVVYSAAVVAAQLCLMPLYATGRLALAWLVGTVVTVAAVVLARIFRWPLWGAAGLAAAGYLLAGGAVVVPELTVAGFVPTPAAIRALLAGIVTSWHEIVTIQPPLGTSAGLLVAPLVMTIAALFACLALAASRSAAGRMAAAAPLGVAAALSLVLATPTSVAPLASGIAVTVGVVGWSCYRAGMLQGRRVVACVVLVGVAVGAGILAGPALGQDRQRFVLRDHLEPAFDPRDYPSPLSAYRRYVKDLADEELLTVTGLPSGGLVRLATMDAYDGIVWKVSGGESGLASGDFRRPGASIGPLADDDAQQVRFTVGALAGPWLPTTGRAISFDFGSATDTIGAGLRYNDATGAAVLVQGVSASIDYSERALIAPVPDDTAIGTTPVAGVDLPRVEGAPEAAALKASQVAASAGSPIALARALQEYLSSLGYFSHGNTAAGEAPSLSGHGAARLNELLAGARMVGDAEQYASAMALMARELGLPARVVMGFRAPADADASTTIVFRGADMDAWVEVCFAGVGWVPFFPTPPASQVPTDDVAQPEPQQGPQVIQPPPPPAEEYEAPLDESELPPLDSPTPPDAQGTVWEWRAWVLGGGIPLLVVVAPLIGIVAAKAIRRRRRRGADPVASVYGGWREVVDTAVDLGCPLPPLATRSMQAAAIAAHFGTRDVGASSRPTTEPIEGSDVRSEIRALAAGADEAVFSGVPPAVGLPGLYWNGVLAACRRLRARRSRWRRFAARVSLASWRSRQGR